MKKPNITRNIKLQGLRFKARIASALRKPSPFAKEQFLNDCADTSLIVKSVSTMIKPARFSISFVDRPDVLAHVKKAGDDDYYFVEVNEAELLVPIYDFLGSRAETYFERHVTVLDADRDLFVRMCMTCAIIMLYWHEAAHVIRGHQNYQKKNGAPTPDWTADPKSFEPWFDPKLHPVLPTRTLELDADIYGAQFALTQAIHSSEIFRNIQRETFLKAFAIGVRGLFEYLSWDMPHETPGATVEHPAAVTRAYLAITHAVARLDKMRVPPTEIARLQRLVLAVLIEFENCDLGMTVNAEVLQLTLKTELKLWSCRSHELDKFKLTPG